LITGPCQFRKDVVDELLDAGALNQFHCRYLDTKDRFQPIDERHRHHGIESELVKRANCIDRFGDA
jgi:hypothetical protein